MEAANDRTQVLKLAAAIAAAAGEAYRNTVLAEVNDHVVRLSVMTEDFYWHRHPDSDETFLVIEGALMIDFEDGTRSLGPGDLLTVPAGIPHRTRPGGGRSVNLTVERAEARTERLDGPGAGAG